MRHPWILDDRVFVAPDQIAVMGVVNVTPDSFSDGGRYLDLEAAVAHALDLVGQGADILDVGGESSRPGAATVPVAEEIHRVVPVVEALCDRTNRPISVDTTKPEVARDALQAGARIINDIRGLADPLMRRLLAETYPNAGIVLMHMQGTPETMQDDPTYEDVLDEVCRFLEGRLTQAETDGIDRRRIAIDPGIGFGKTLDHNLALLRHLDRLNALGCAILVGTSRKRFLGALTGRDVEDRLIGSVVSSLAAAVRGAAIVRVHDVGQTVDALTVWNSLQPRAN